MPYHLYDMIAALMATGEEICAACNPACIFMWKRILHNFIYYTNGNYAGISEFSVHWVNLNAVLIIQAIIKSDKSYMIDRKGGAVWVTRYGVSYFADN